MALDNLDSSIPLAAGQIPQNFNAQQNAMLQMQMRMQQLRQVQQSENALRQLYSPGNLDASGRPTANAMGRYMQADPRGGIELQTKFGQMDEHKLRADALRGEVTEQHRKTGHEIGTDVLSTYETTLKDTGDEKLANQRAQERRAELVDQACKEGSLPGACQKTFLPWDPVKYRAAKSSYEAANTKPMTGYQAQELGIQKGRLGLEAEKLNVDTKHKEDVLAETAQSHRTNEATKREELDLKKKKAESEAGLLSPESTTTMAEQYLAGDRSVMQNLGRGAQGAQNIVKLRGEIAKKMGERGMSGQDMATKMAEFEGLKAGERTLTQRTANIGMRIAEAKTFAPLALSASEKVDRTRFPTINSLLLAAEKGTGGEDVVRLSVATQSLLNAYAAAVTPTGTPTEGAQARAHELLDKAWSQGQFKTAIDQLMMEMEAASKSPGMVREEFRRGADPGTSTNAPEGNKPAASPPKGAAAAQPPGGSLEMTKEQVDKLPRNSVFMKQGDPTVYYKDW